MIYKTKNWKVKLWVRERVESADWGNRAYLTRIARVLARDLDEDELVRLAAHSLVEMVLGDSRTEVRMREENERYAQRSRPSNTSDAQLKDYAEKAVEKMIEDQKNGVFREQEKRRVEAWRRDNPEPERGSLERDLWVQERIIHVDSRDSRLRAHESAGMASMARRIAEQITTQIRTRDMIEDRARELHAEWRDDLLAGKFALGDGSYVSWGDATVEQHRRRAETLSRMAGSTADTASLHLRAVTDLEAAGKCRLRELMED